MSFSNREKEVVGRPGIGNQQKNNPAFEMKREIARVDVGGGRFNADRKAKGEWAFFGRFTF